ncbi:hypothetical protein GGX14DRAFT_397497 [Mycena pura]|uniref:Uncharacterized protein n=1 Tax=Mycena pura TaxID=153505 RepID=A0AAD6VCE9_9AGAR|nr:hypothetical protein GGX14DRAFT_397497 [Mycena pura]
MVIFVAQFKKIVRNKPKIAQEPSFAWNLEATLYSNYLGGSDVSSSGRKDGESLPRAQQPSTSLAKISRAERKAGGGLTSLRKPWSVLARRKRECDEADVSLLVLVGHKSLTRFGIFGDAMVMTTWHGHIPYVDMLPHLHPY